MAMFVHGIRKININYINTKNRPSEHLKYLSQIMIYQY